MARAQWLLIVLVFGLVAETFGQEQPPAEQQAENQEQPVVEQPPVQEQSPVTEEQPPVEQQSPVEEQPPVEQPPVEQPPVEQPPVEQPPVEQPPVEQQPPPVTEEQPPVEQQSPATEEQPVQEQPPATEEAQAQQQQDIDKEKLIEQLKLDTLPTAFTSALLTSQPLTVDGATPPNAIGSASAFYNSASKSLLVFVSYEGLSGDVKAAHIRKGPVGQDGEIVITLCGEPEPSLQGSCGEDPTGWIFGVWDDLDAETVGTLLSTGLYINLETELNNGGEVRGQLIAL